MVKAFGRNVKRIVMHVYDDNHMRFMVKLKHHGVRQYEFFRVIIKAYSEDNPLLDKFIEEYLKTRQVYIKRHAEIFAKERKSASKIEKAYGLDEEDIEDIYDLLEEECDL